MGELLLLLTSLCPWSMGSPWPPSSTLCLLRPASTRSLSSSSPPPPTPVINGQNVAPGLNTVPAQTAAHENHQLIAQQQQLQQLIDAQTIQHRVQQQEIEAARHFGRL